MTLPASFPGFKGAAFRRGHVVRKSDIPKLLDMGKKQVYVLKLDRGELHEDEAARRLARAIAGRGLRLRGPREGKIDFLAKGSGLLKVNTSALEKINSLGSIIVSTRHNHTCGPTRRGRGRNPDHSSDHSGNEDQKNRRDLAVRKDRC